MNRYRYLLLLLLCSSGMFSINGVAQVPSYVSTNGLKAWYSLRNNAVDSSGNGNNGTVTGCVAVPDRFGTANSAYRFNGISNYIYIPPSSSLNITGSVSLAAWVKSTYVGSGDHYILFRGDTRPVYDPYSLALMGGYITFGRSVGTGLTFNTVGFPASIIDTSGFHLLVSSYDSTDDTMKIYLDGVLQQAAYMPGTITYFTDSAQNGIGACDYGSSRFFTGTIDDEGIWNRELTLCEIKRLYKSNRYLYVNTQPANVSTGPGATVTFSISDTGVGNTYQWQVNGGSGFTNIAAAAPYSGVTTPTLTITSVSLGLSGNKYRCVVVGALCTDSSAYATLLIPTGVQNHYKNTLVTVAPNPVTSDLYISGADGAHTRIYDNIGRLVIAEINKGKIDVGVLPGGIYVIELTDEEGVLLYRDKLVKQ
jgi:hypothetical protein